MLKSVMAGVVALSMSQGWAAAGTRPNIVLVYVDDLDFDQLSVYDHRKFPCYTGAKDTGNLTEQNVATACQNGRFLKIGEMSYYKEARMLTPNVEKLASNGVTFNRFYLTSSTCTPSRYSLLTGRYASRAKSVLESCPADQTPMISWNSHIDPEENNLARDLKAAGYKTGLVGKWHINNYLIDGVDFEPGFRQHHIKNGTGKGLREHQYVGSYFPVTTDYGDSAVQAEVKRIYDAMHKKVLTISGFDTVDRLYYANYGELPLPKHMKVHNLEWLTEGALEFIDESTAPGNNGKEKPFFLYFSITAPHGQYFADWMEKDWRPTPAGMLTERPKGMPSRNSVLERVRKAGLPPQNAMATWIDDSLGAVMNKLEERGVADNTIVMFISDHQSRGKMTTYEGHRAPAIISWPGRTKGRYEERICSNIDILPTLLDIAGSEPRKGATTDGLIMTPILKGETPRNWRDSLLLETSYSRAVIHNDWKYIANRPSKAVRDKMDADRIDAEKTGRRRHVGWLGRTTPGASGHGVRFNADQDFPYYFDPDQLYNLGEDVFEQHNLYDNPEYSAKVKQLKKIMDEHIADLPHRFGEFGNK